MQNAIFSKVHTILTQVYNTKMTDASSYYAAVSGGAITQTAIDDAIDHVIGENGRAVVFANRSHIRTISKFTGFAAEALEEIRKTGVLGVYNGATLIALPKIKDEYTGDVIFPSDRLYVVGNKIGYSGTYGNTSSMDEINVNDKTWSMRLDKEWGMAVTDTDGMFTIDITA
jgi:hypothetical protein